MGILDEALGSTGQGSIVDEALSGKPATMPEKSLMGRIADRYKKVPISASDMLHMRTPLVAAGQTVGALGDAAVTGIGNLVSAATPDVIKGEVSKLKNSKVLQGLMESSKYYGDIYRDWASRNPEQSTGIESIANIASVLPIGAGSKALAGGMGRIAATEPARIAKDATRIAAETFKTIPMTQESGLRTTVKKAFEKAGIKPRDKIGADQFYDNATSAVQDIVRFSPEKISIAERPLEAAANGLNEAKSNLFKSADAMVKEAGMEGLPLTKQKEVIQSILDPNSKYKTVLDSSPELKNGLVAKLDYLNKNGKATAEQIQTEIKHYNSRAANRNTISKTDNEIQALIANATREDLESGLMALDKAGHADFMKRYGALKDVEKQFADIAIKTYGRQNFSYLDTLSAAGGLTGILTTNPAVILASASTAGTLHGINLLRSPERYVKKMFKEVEKQQAKKELIDKLQSHYFRNKAASLNNVY
jgi:hypothetical protein